MRKCVYGYSTTPLERLFRFLFSRPLLKRDFRCILIRCLLLLIVPSVYTAYEVVVQFLWLSLGQNLMPSWITWVGSPRSLHIIISNRIKFFILVDVFSSLKRDLTDVYKEFSNFPGFTTAFYWVLLLSWYLFLSFLFIRVL